MYGKIMFTKNFNFCFTYFIGNLTEKMKHLFHTLSTHKGEDELQRQKLFEKLIRSSENSITEEDKEKLFSKSMYIRPFQIKVTIQFHYLVKTCELGRQEVLEFILNEFDGIQRYSDAYWHAANNGHSNMINLLLEKVDNIDIIDSKAPDGTTPLMMAIAKGHSDVINIFENIFGKDRMIAERAKFGQIHDITLPYKMKTLQEEAMRNAVFSSKKKVIDFVQIVTNNLEFPRDVPDHVIKRKILQFTGHDSAQKTSALMGFTKKFPLFNEKIEQKGEKSTQIKWPHLCCMKDVHKSNETIYVEDINLKNPCDK